jgi:hypothetical protein
MPPDLVARYSMDGRARIEDWYLNSIPRPGENPVFTVNEVSANLHKIGERETNYYGETDTGLYEALDSYPIRRLDLVNMGSTNPWYESVAIFYGAATVTVIEYNRIVSQHDQIRALTPDDFEQEPRSFDAGFSISSFEHDGLGRYGDPLDPDADLTAMQRMKAVIKPGGLLYLAVPIGQDKVVWNAHRIYGKHRFPRLIEGWELLASFNGFDRTALNKDTGMDGGYQPVHVLRNPGP